MSDQASVYSEWTRKARKPHKCCECRGAIQPGETYHVFSGCWDGEWSDFKTCPDCNKLRSEIGTDCGWHDGEGLLFGQLYEDVFGSKDLEWITRFMDTRRNRNAQESPNGWMERREIELKLKAA